MDSNNIKVHIVYYSYIGGVDPFPDGKYFWKDVIKGQLRDIKESGILDVSKIYVVICSEKNSLLEEASELINNELDGFNYSFETETINRYEYPGIKKIYDISKENKNGVCLYLHSKQLGHSNVLENHRGQTEMVCTQNTLKHWERIINMFENKEHYKIQKACLFPSENGFSWFNFWWARTNYIAKCKEPTIEEDRYYYERWLGEQGSNTYEDCLSLFTGQITGMNGSQACGYSRYLEHKL